MKFFIVFTCLLAVAFANENPGVIRSEAEVNIHDFKYALELDNGLKIQQQGDLKDPEIWEVKGNSEHISPEGESVSIQYVANENGYQVLAANPPLPTSPPIPEPILRAIEYIRSHPIPENQN